jgi:hypothetical protein
MPTGYTSDVVDGKIKDFSQFAMMCSRAMMPLISMREESFRAKIPNKFKPDDYNLKRMQEKKEELLNFLSLSERQIADLYKKENKSRIQSIVKSLKDVKKSNENCLKMLSKVKAWKEPSEHIEFKKFMIQQLEISMSSVEYYENEIKRCKENSINQTQQEWAKEKIQSLNEDIEYHEKEYKKDKERAEFSTKWVQNLRNSLKEYKGSYVKKSKKR